MTDKETLLFVAADPRECAEWVTHWSESRPIELPVHWARAGVWKSRNVLAAANGAGKGRAYDAVKNVAKVTRLSGVCSIGFCGALDEALQVGDVVQVTEVRSSDSKAAALSAASEPLVCESVDHIVATAQEKRTLRQTGASVVEMEAAGVAKAASELKIPFHCVRVVSDLAQESFANNFERAMLPDGTFSVARLVWGALGNPVIRFPELVRMARRTSIASKNLGEALAHHSF